MSYWIDGLARWIWVSFMRGVDRRRDGLFSYVRPESRIPKDHPLRLIRQVTDEALVSLNELFSALYSEIGRPSIPPEQLLRALLLQAFYSIRSERQLMEQLNYNLLFRWFVGLGVDDPVWLPTVFSKNRDRLLAGEVAAEFMAAVLQLPRVGALLSDEHFSVDGTLIQAWASMKSLRRKDGTDEPPGPGRNGERNFRGEKRSNETHASTTDPDARLARKSNGQEAKLGFTGHLLMENRNSLLVDARLSQATGTAEPETALEMLSELPGSAKKTVGADKNYDTAAFVAAARDLNVTPHVAQNINPHRGSNIDGRTTRHEGYRASQIIRKRIEEANGWIKEVAGMAQTRHRGLGRVGWMFTFKAAAYNLIRLPRLLPTG
jgi:transposase